MTEVKAPAKVITYFIETCRHQAVGTLKIRARDGSEDPYCWPNRVRAEKALQRRFGKSKPCALCGEDELEVHPAPFEQRYPFPQFAQEECVKLHASKAPAALRNPKAAVYRVENCTGDLLGFVTVLKALRRFEREEHAGRIMCRRFGKPHSCGQCGDISHQLRQVSGPGLWR